MRNRARARRSRTVVGILPSLAFGLCLAGCGDLDRRGAVARVGDWTLEESRLAELLVLAQPFPLDSAAARDLVRHWTAAAALALRHAAGDSLSGGEAVAASTWLARRESLLAADRERRLGGLARVDAAEVERTFREGSLRLIAHALRRTGPETSSSERVLQRRAAERLLGALVEGGAWDQVARESEDLETKAEGGLLGLFGPGELPSTLDRTAFSLEPGQVSGVVQSGRGFHLLYRPRFEEIRSLYANRLFRRRLTEADERASRRDREARGFRTTPGAEATLSAILRDPAEWLESPHVLATWGPSPTGGSEAQPAGSDAAGVPEAADEASANPAGSLTAGVAARYALFLPESTVREIEVGHPEDRADLIRDFGSREMRLSDASRRGAALDSATEASLRRAHADELEFWTQELALDDADAPPRAALASHMERVVARRVEARTLPRLFEAWLLEGVRSEVRARGVLAAVVQARTLIEEAEP